MKMGLFNSSLRIEFGFFPIIGIVYSDKMLLIGCGLYIGFQIIGDVK